MQVLQVPFYFWKIQFVLCSFSPAILHYLHSDIQWEVKTGATQFNQLRLRPKFNLKFEGLKKAVDEY